MNGISNDLLDVIYTPLDTSTSPDVDLVSLMEWVCESKAKEIQNPLPGRQNAESKIDPKIYPWTITYARINHQWQNGFNQRFPELARFFYEAYGITESDLARVVLLPVKQEFEGRGFWHSDPDEVGLRTYLFNEEPNNSLWFKFFKQPYEERGLVHHHGEALVASPKASQLLDSDIHVATMVHPKQTFFINNVRALHCVNVTDINATRIAVIVAVKNDIMTEGIRNLIKRSVDKYSEHVIKRT